MASSTISWGLTRTVSLSPRSLASMTWSSSSPGSRGRRGVAVGRYGEFPHRHHVRPAVEFLLGERDGAPDRAAEVRLGGSGDVGGQAPGSGPARRVAGHGAEAHDAGVGQELAGVGGLAGT